MIKREKITLVFWLLLSIFFCIESVHLGLGSIHAPGPGFLTFWVAIILILFVIILFLKEKGKRIVGQVEPLFRGKNLRNIIYGNIFLFGYGLLFEKIGFVLCTALFVGSCLGVIGKKRWGMTVAISLSVTLIAYLLFVVWLQVQFPKGRWVGRFLPF